MTTPNGNGTHTAQVTNLTATVHSLEIGPRQVTLSIARQLDMVNPRMIVPFGRVRITHHPIGIEVIGAHAVTRELVRAHGNRSSWLDGQEIPADSNHLDAEEYQRWRELPLIVLAGR